MSDPKSGADEALGRMLNGLALAHETHEAGDEVEIVFKGAGTRWPGELARLTHPAHEHYQSVRESVKGASLGCAMKYGAHEDVKASGVPLLADQPLPGTPGIAGLRSYYADGWNVVVF
jgi:hypothetical protein